MASFASDVMKSTEEKDPNLEKKKQEALARQAAVIQRQFGGQQTLGAPKIGIGSSFGSQATQAQVTADEANRRKQAATNAFAFGSQVDARKSKISDELQAALTKRQRNEADWATKQSQQNRENALGTKETLTGMKQSIDKLSFNNYKSQSERNEAMRKAYVTGDLEKQIQSAATQGALKQQDLDNYFSMLEAELNAEFARSSKDLEFGWEEYKASLDAKARNLAAIFSGAAGVAQSGMDYYDKNKTKTGPSAEKQAIISGQWDVPNTGSMTT